MAPRARTEEAQAFFVAVYDAVREIPAGRVTSYGYIAELIGRPECPRQVGVCLKHLPHASSSPDGDDDGASNTPYHNANVPWQRVINAKGMISPRGPGSARRQADALTAEGVEVGRTAMGEYTVDFDRYGWFPAELQGS